MKLNFFATFIILMAYLPLQAQITSIKMDSFDEKNIKDSLVLNLYQTFENFKKDYSDSFTINSDKEFFFCYLTPKLVYDEDQTVAHWLRYDSTKIEILLYWGYNRKVSKKIFVKGEEVYDKLFGLLNLIPSEGFFRQEWDMIRRETRFLFLKREKNNNVSGLFSFNRFPKGDKNKSYPTEEMVKAVLDIFLLID